MTIRIVWFVSGLIVFCNTSYARWQDGEYGETAIFEMKNAPYPHNSRDEGYTMREMYYPPRDGHYVYRFEPEIYPREPHYTDCRVGLFIPREYRQTDKVDLMFFFHGAYINIDIALAQEDWALRKQVHDSGKNVVFVLPQGPNRAADVSGGGKLMEPNGLKRLVEEVLETLKSEGKTTTTKLGRIGLSGHSAGNYVITYCLEHGGLEDHIREVYLMDGVFDRFEQYPLWRKRNPQGRLLSIFTDGLAWQHVSMMVQMKRDRFPYELMGDEEVTDEILHKERTIFMFTKDTHHNTGLQLSRYLRTSGFEDR